MKRYLAVLLAVLLGMPSTLYADSLSISAWSTGDALNATNLNSRHTTIQNLINGNLANDNIKSSAGIVGSKLDLTSGTGRISHSTSVTDDAPILTSAQTWSDAAEVFSGWRLTVTNTNSASTSRLIDLRVGSTIIASISRTGQFILAPQAYASGPTTMMEGAWFNVASATMTDNITAASGTAPRFIAYAFQRPAIAAANSSVTTSDAATLFIASAPVAGDNMTLTRRYAVWVDQGDVRIGGNLFASGTTTIVGDLAIPGGITGSLVVDGVGPHAIGGATHADRLFRILGTFTGGSQARGFDVAPTLVPAAGEDAYGGIFVPNITRVGGTHTDFIGLYVATPSLVGSAGTVTNFSTLKIQNAPSGATNNYALWVAGGNSRIDSNVFASGSAFIQGELHIGGQGSSANALWVDASISRFDGQLRLNTASSTTGTATATLGTNAPVGQTTPFVWLSVIASDGTAVFVPAWR